MANGKGISLFFKDGSFNSAYVKQAKGNVLTYTLGKIIKDIDLEKNEEIVYDNETIDDANARNRLDYLNATSNAKIVAYKYSNTPYEIKNLHFYVTYVTPENDSALKVGDELISYDNIKMTSFDDFKDYINSKSAGDKIKITYLRNNEEFDTKATLYEEENALYTGLGIMEEKDVESEKEIDIKTKDSESGPSGGLIMALSMYNALTSEDITYGMKIVGTGTIDEDGTVGKIGSVTYKLAAAVKAKADLFICPSDNYDEALKYAKDKKYEITIRGVDTFEEALNVLKDEGEGNEIN